VGSLVLGTRAFVDRARKIRRALGGTMRQAGIIAAPGLVALRTLIGRLADDHENAAWFAKQVASIDGLSVDLASVQSNIVNVDVGSLGMTAAAFAKHLDPLGVRGLPGMASVIRFVTYRGITRADVEMAVQAVRGLVAEKPWAAAR
jgi:threonine aldolase